MKMNELKLVYFSPAGTTRKVVMEIAKNIELKSASFDFSAYKDKRSNLRFKKNDFALFAVPVYCGRVPNPFIENLCTLKGDGTPAALAVTYGCTGYDDAVLELKNEVEKRGFKVIGAAVFPAEHSLSRSIAYGRPEKDDLKAAADYGIRLGKRLKQESLFDAFDIKVPGNFPYKEFERIKLYPKYSRGICTECKACVKACPTGAIATEKLRKIDRKKCINCLKCVRVCRQGARSISDFKMNIVAKKLIRECDVTKKAEIFM